MVLHLNTTTPSVYPPKFTIKYQIDDQFKAVIKEFLTTYRLHHYNEIPFEQ